MACKGTERTMGPPNSLNPREAPFRRAIRKSRATQKVFMEQTWEQYDQLSKRQLIRKSFPSRVVFAANQTESQPSVPTDAALLASRKDASESSDHEEEASVRKETDFKQQIEDEGVNSQMLPKESQHAEASEASNATNPSEHSQTDKHGPRFRALPREEQAMLKCAHQNLCHPSHDHFSAVLRAQGKITQAVYDMSCPVCAASQKLKIARPSTLKSNLISTMRCFWMEQHGQIDRENHSTFITCWIRPQISMLQFLPQAEQRRSHP